MSLKTRGRYRYGETQADIREELKNYSKANDDPAEHFADAVCARCGGRVFQLLMDRDEGVALRTCTGCGDRHPMGDSAEHRDDADPEECRCACGKGDFEITGGVALYQGSRDVRWLYIGCRCIHCGLTGCYGDWTSEYENYQKLLQAL